MKSLAFAFISILIVSCNGPGGGGGRSAENPQVTSGNSSYKDETKKFMQESQAGIEPSLQIQQTEVDQWVTEGTLTQEEAQELSKNI